MFVTKGIEASLKNVIVRKLITYSVQQTSYMSSSKTQRSLEWIGMLATPTTCCSKFSKIDFYMHNLLHTARVFLANYAQDNTHHDGSSTCPYREKSVCRSKALTEVASPLTQRLHCGELGRKKGKRITVITASGCHQQMFIKTTQLHVLIISGECAVTTTTCNS